MIRKFEINRYKNQNKINYFLKQLGLIIILVIILRSLYFSFRSDYYSKKRELEACSKVKEMGFNGIIDSINNSLYVKTKHFFIKNNSTKFTMWYYRTSFLEKGDSIVKRRGESKYVIYKEDKLFNDSIILIFECK